VLAVSTYGGEESLHTGFWWRNLRERDHLEDPSIGGRIILKGELRIINTIHTVVPPDDGPRYARNV
jgi:hypothetical protein